MRKKLSLTEIGSYFKQNIDDSIAWVCMDIYGVHCFSLSKNIPSTVDCNIYKPTYNYKHNQWRGNDYCKSIVNLDINIKYINTRDYTQHSDIVFDKAIECVESKILESLSVSKQRKAHHTKKIIAFFASGATIIFDSKLEAKDFFGLKRVEQVTQYVRTGNPLPDGSTTLDEALEG